MKLSRGVIHQAICPESIMICDHRTAKLGMLCFSRLTWVDLKCSFLKPRTVDMFRLINISFDYMSNVTQYRKTQKCATKSKWASQAYQQLFTDKYNTLLGPFWILFWFCDCKQFDIFFGLTGHSIKMNKVKTEFGSTGHIYGYMTIPLELEILV